VLRPLLLALVLEIFQHVGTNQMRSWRVRTMSIHCLIFWLVVLATRAAAAATAAARDGEQETVPMSLSSRQVQAATGNAAVTYVPGKATVFENGLILSQGLKSRLIAQARLPVIYANGTQSSVPFHRRPDGAAIFLDPNSTNYKYVSNSEAYLGGGVGSWQSHI
jgi:hypothetical protein